MRLRIEPSDPPVAHPAGPSPARHTPARRTPARRTPGRRTPGRRTPARRTPARRTPGPALRAAALGLAALALGACSGGGIAIPGGPAPEGGEGEARGVPGFDTRIYPGADVMRAWRDASPYRWVGYYLPAPCHTGESWVGRRGELRSMGWGFAVVFVGEQDWPEHLDDQPAAGAADPESADTGADDEPRCTRDNLSRDSGLADGAEAAATARSEGFPGGTIVYLDVERVDEVSDALAAYVAGWTTGLMDAGYEPGLYAHARNARTLREAMHRARGTDGPAPPLWVASTGGFNLRRGPRESGFSATIWQGILDTRESWGGTTLRIDANVADRPDPSRPGG